MEDSHFFGWWEKERAVSREGEPIDFSGFFARWMRENTQFEKNETDRKS